MPHINLLPWREELRQRRQKEFGVMAGVAVLAMVGVVIGVHLHMQSRIDFQNSRNAFLETAIGELDKQIKEIKTLEKKRERLIARTRRITQLQSGRPDIVHLMDAFVETLPEGVYFSRIAQAGIGITIDGVAQSNARVSSLMRQLEGSDWLQDPALRFIRRAEGGDQGPGAIPTSRFQLVVTQTRTKAKNPDADS